LSARRLASPDKTRRKNARVVDDQVIAFVQLFGQLREGTVAPRCARAIQHEQTRSVALGERCLRDQLFGQFVVEFGDQHVVNREAWITKGFTAETPSKAAE
jgi:hypothetical protein